MKYIALALFLSWLFHGDKCFFPHNMYLALLWTILLLLSGALEELEKLVSPKD